jgi:hypothetical protein
MPTLFIRAVKLTVVCAACTASTLALSQANSAKKNPALRQEIARQRTLYKNPSPLFAAMSKAAECAAGLIESEYSLGAVVAGGSFLHEILRKIAPDKYQSINAMDHLIETCALVTKEVEKYRDEIKSEELASELQISLGESPFKKRLIALLTYNLHRQARCTENAYTLSVGAGVGLQIGYNRTKCHTPYGRRFILHGPHFGVNYGGAGFAAVNQHDEVRVPIRGSGRYAINSAMYVGVTVVSGQHAHGIDYQDKVPGPVETRGSVGDTYGFGFFGYYGGKLGHLNARKFIKPNFVRLFEYFGVAIPAR